MIKYLKLQHSLVSKLWRSIAWQQSWLLSPRRGTVIVARKHELDRPYPELDDRPLLQEIDDYPNRVPIYSKLYETADLLAKRPDSEQLLPVKLARDVPGLGEAGQLAYVHRSRYWHYLYPLGWATIASKSELGSGASANQATNSSGAWRDARVFTGPLYQLQRTLELMHLLVPVNQAAIVSQADQFQLTERHLCVAFRRYGIEVPRQAIKMPDKLPKLAVRSAQRQKAGSASGGAVFRVGVQLNNRVTVQVKASLHAVTLGEPGGGGSGGSLPPVQLPQIDIDNWLTEMHPSPSLPDGERLFENYMRQQGPPDFERLLKSNRTRVRKQ